MLVRKVNGGCEPLRQPTLRDGRDLCARSWTTIVLGPFYRRGERRARLDRRARGALVHARVDERQVLKFDLPVNFFFASVTLFTSADRSGRYINPAWICRRADTELPA